MTGGSTKGDNLRAAKADSADANASGEQRCPEVGPTILIEDPKTVVVARDYYKKHKKKYKLEPHRIALRLGVDQKFDGEGTLTAVSEGDRIRLFTKQKGGKEKKLPLRLKAKDFNGGKTLYIEAVKPSSGAEKTELQWELKKGKLAKKAPVTEKITCVKLTLDLFKARTMAAPAAEPVQLAEDASHDPGRYIHVQASDPLPQGAGDPAPVPADKLPYERAQVIVRPVEPNDWEGTILLVPCDQTGKANASSSIEIFAEEEAAQSQAAVSTPHEIDHAPGFADLKLWVQGKSASKKLLDSPLKLGVKGTTDSSGDIAEGDRVVLTVVKAELALCQSRSEPPKKSADLPAEMSSEDKHTRGRFVHVQFDQHHGRAGILVKAVEPKDFRGKLKLAVWDRASDAEDTSRIELFDQEVPATGQAAQPNPLDVEINKAHQKNGKCFWAQGKDVSASLRDTFVRLALPDHFNIGDSGRLTSVRFKTLEADIPSSAPNQVRPRTAGGASNGPVPRHSLKLADPNPAAVDYDHDFGNNVPLVLIEGSIKDADKVKLTAAIEPAAASDFVSWSANRDRRSSAPKGDHSKIIKLAGNSDDPGLVADPADKLKATLQANAVGSFHVHTYIDNNQNDKFEFDDKKGKRIDREPYLCMNLVLVRVQGVNNLTVVNNAAGSRDIETQVVGGQTQPAAVNTGDFASTGNDAIHMKATAHVIGGGRDGKRGLDQVFCGWVNNEHDCPTSPGPHGEDVTHVFRAPLPPAPPPPPPPAVAPPLPPPPPIKQTRCFWDQNGVEIAGPMLDSGYDAQGTGGNSCTGTAGANGGPPTKKNHKSKIGQNWEAENVDSPGGGVLTVHPTDAAATLRNFKFNIDFRCDYVFWTNRNKVEGPDDFPACRLYSSVSTNRWQIRLESSFDDNYVETRVTRKTVTVTKDPDPTRRATPVDGNGLETRQPDGLDNAKFDEPF